MRAKCSKVSLTALLLLLFAFSISLSGDPRLYRNSGKSTGHTWDEKGEGGSIIFKSHSRDYMDGYYIIFTNPYNWVILDFSKMVKKNGSTKAGETLK
ncbi:MAG TPA: hypothetical protein VJ165_02030 [candidate division Zixibacteria bacterium]|nr:hypothetical protein [candidate division Zixibacteria bacterium]